MNDIENERLTILSDSLSLTSIKTHLKEMIAIPSVNPMSGAPRPGYREREIGEYYLDQMNQLGMDVSSRDVAPGRPNIFGVLPGITMEGVYESLRTPIKYNRDLMGDLTPEEDRFIQDFIEENSMTKRTFGGTSRKRKRVSGFRVRMRTHTGRNVIRSRRKKGRARIAV